MVRERRKAAPPTWREQFEEDQEFDVALLDKRTSKGSELQFSDSLQRGITVQQNEIPPVGNRLSIRDKSKSDFDDQ